MELGLSFDDSFFENTKRRSESNDANLVSYNAKFCPEKWFVNYSPDDVTEQVQVWKFKAERSYKENKFEESLKEYRNALEILPAHSFGLRRDIFEGVARCSAKLGYHDDAVKYAQILYIEEANLEQKTVGLRLLAYVNREAGNLKEERDSLQKCVSLHLYNAGFWSELAKTYVKEAETSSHPPGVHICNKMAATVCPRLAAISCLIRARLLLLSVHNTVGSFIKEANKRQQEEISQKLQALSVDKETEDRCIKALGSDILNCPISEASGDPCQQTETKEELVDEFETKWFSWTCYVTD